VLRPGGFYPANDTRPPADVFGEIEKTKRQDAAEREVGETPDKLKF
jgi:hypothetical protein